MLKSILIIFEKQKVKVIIINKIILILINKLPLTKLIGKNKNNKLTIVCLFILVKSILNLIKHFKYYTVFDNI